MALLRPRITISQAELAEALRRQTEPAQRRMAERLAREMEDECVKLARERTERRPVDRRKVNTTHLEESFVGRAVKIQGQWRAVLTVKPGVNKAKIGALEFGIDHPYEIAPRNAGRLAWTDKSGTKTVLPVGRVVKRNPKPGTKEYDGIHMMRDARNIVVRRHRG